MIRTKISGITDLFTAKTAEKAGVDFISFVFDMDNKYYIPPVNAEIISKQMPDMRKVGIFTDEDLDVVNSVADMVGLDYVQLNGAESDEYVRQVHCPVIKRYYYNKHFFSLQAAKKCPAKMILLDIGPQDYHKKNLAQDMAGLHKSVIIASDINSNDVEQLNNDLHPYAVEVTEGPEEIGNIKILNYIMLSKMPAALRAS